MCHTKYNNKILANSLIAGLARRGKERKSVITKDDKRGGNYTLSSGHMHKSTRTARSEKSGPTHARVGQRQQHTSQIQTSIHIIFTIPTLLTPSSTPLLFPFPFLSIYVMDLACTIFSECQAGSDQYHSGEGISSTQYEATKQSIPTTPFQYDPYSVTIYFRKKRIQFPLFLNRNDDSLESKFGVYIMYIYI